jgi:proline iminopeptidase
MPIASVNGTTLHYEVDGQGWPGLVLHGGLGIDHSLYRATLPAIVPTLRLVFFDQRGNGRSGRPPIETLTIEQLADDVAGLADHLGLDQFLVFGHSYGGFVAQEFGIRHPERVAGLVLVGTTPGQLGSDETADEYQGPTPPAELITLLNSEPETDADWAAMWRAAFPYFFHRPPGDALAGALDSTVFAADAKRRSGRLLKTWSSVDRLPRVTAPVLLIVGGFDTVCSPPQSRRIARRLPNATIEVLKESNHWPWIEEPDRFSAVLARWLARVETSSPDMETSTGQSSV